MYNFARTLLITGLPIVYGIPIAFTRGVVTRHELFTSTAVIKNERIITVNAADSYDYTVPGSLGEWFTAHANKKFNHVKDIKINSKFGGDIIYVFFSICIQNYGNKLSVIFIMALIIL